MQQKNHFTIGFAFLNHIREIGVYLNWAACWHGLINSGFKRFVKFFYKELEVLVQEKTFLSLNSSNQIDQTSVMYLEKVSRDMINSFMIQDGFMNQRINWPKCENRRISLVRNVTSEFLVQLLSQIFNLIIKIFNYRNKNIIASTFSCLFTTDSIRVYTHFFIEIEFAFSIL